LRERRALAALNVLDLVVLEVEVEAEREHARRLLRTGASRQLAQVLAGDAIEVHTVASLHALAVLVLAAGHLHVADQHALARRLLGRGCRRRGWRRVGTGRLDLGGRAAQLTSRRLGSGRHRYAGYELHPRQARPGNADRETDDGDDADARELDAVLLRTRNLDLYGLSLFARSCQGTPLERRSTLRSLQKAPAFSPNRGGA
jgi:hypothetical protein